MQKYLYKKNKGKKEHSRMLIYQKMLWILKNVIKLNVKKQIKK
jgi:hypothetical protein